jgi:PAS domain S-box-containing protein
MVTPVARPPAERCAELLAMSREVFCGIVDERIVWLSGGWTQALGWPEEALIGRPLLELIHPDDLQATQDWTQMLEQNGRVEGFNHRMRHEQGGWRWLEWTAESRGDLIQAVGRDVTEQTDTLRSLQRRMRTLSMVERMAGVGHWCFEVGEEPDPPLLYWSAQVYQIHGKDPSSYQPSLQEAIKLYHVGDRPKVRRAIKAAIETRRPMEFEARLVPFPGELRFVRVVGQPELDEEGKIVSVFGVITDITVQKRMEVESRRAIDAAQKAAACKSDFLANMSHEIRTPLNGVVGMTDLLLETPLSPEQKDYVEAARGAGQHLKALLNDILDLSKIEAHRLRLDDAPFELVAALDVVAGTFGMQAARKAIELKTQAFDQPVWLRGDVVRVKQILMNLVANAVKFTDRGTVELRATLTPEGVRFEVEDTGPGIPLASQGGLFRRFNQVDGSGTRRHGGTGLGLSLCRELTELMDGRIGLSSEPGRGSCFWVELPLTHGGQTEASPLGGTGQDVEAAALRILVAEDNPTNQLLIRRLLERRGHAVTLVEDGAEAVDAALAAAYDLILMDVQMPHKDGWEATTEIRDRGCVSPIFALTANAEADASERALELGMNGCLTKPIDIASLDSLLRGLGQRKLQSEDFSRNAS